MSLPLVQTILCEESKEVYSDTLSMDMGVCVCYIMHIIYILYIYIYFPLDFLDPRTWWPLKSIYLE